MTASMRIGAALVAVLGLGACAPKAIGPASGSEKASADAGAGPKIKDDELARIPEADLGPVHQLEAQLPPLKDAAARADQDVAVADKQVAVEEANVAVAQAQTKVADAENDLAEATGNRARIAQASDGQRAALAGVQLAQARADLAARLRDRAKIEAMEAHDRLQLQQAKVEQAKLAALRQSGDAAADHYDPAAFQKRITDLDAKRRLVDDDRDAMQTQLRIAQDRVRETRISADEHPVRGLDPLDAGEGGAAGQNSQPPQD